MCAERPAVLQGGFNGFSGFNGRSNDGGEVVFCSVKWYDYSQQLHILKSKGGERREYPRREHGNTY